MNYTDQRFPLIKYCPKSSYREWGLQHGETYRKGIQELIEIRKKLMIEKKPNIQKHFEFLANQQWKVSKEFAPDICKELKGISDGANVSLTDIIILNNYTDFRDIPLPDEGCSTIHINSDSTIAGQTWDMHGSAKNYLCLIEIPEHNNNPGSICFSLVGCVGMMGINTNNLMIGVNNINTKNAKAGVIWPVLIRKVLLEKRFEQLRNKLITSPVTSGHNYLISTTGTGEHWEITPTEQECVAQLSDNSPGHIFHTNHCLGKKIIPLEDSLSVNSTTKVRYDILNKNLENTKDLNGLEQILKSHENFPKSICSHFESNTQDPSFTCGGGIVDFTDNQYYFWRGCQEYDKNFVDYRFSLQNKGNINYFSKI